MTLFDTPPDTAPSDLTSRRTSHLPIPTKDRFAPLRAGVLNMWEYDDQQFWFTDGRLLLRGRNEAGKSKVLELLFPFVLDGDMDPKKLDPFATVSKSMYWNLLGWQKDTVAKPRASAIGYLWIEFGRIDESGTPTYLTAIVGLQTTASEKKVHPWFALTPQRIGADLDLAPGDIPRTQDSFTKALSATARFETKATQHRANIANHLFSMSPDRYGNLLHLLRQLRKPKLAEKLDGKKLSSILTNALPPLDESRLRDLAEGFGLLDTLVQELAQAEVAHRTTTAFLDVYRTYARSVVRQRAFVVTRKVSQFDQVTRDETAAQRALADAHTKTSALEVEAQQIARDLSAATGSLSGLDLTAVETLNSLEQVATSHRDAHTTATRVADDAETRRQRAQDHAQEREAELVQAATKVDEDLHTAQWAANKAGVPTGWVSPDDHTRSAANLERETRVRRGLIEAVADAERAAFAAKNELTGARARVDAATTRAHEAAEEHSEAVAASDAQRTSFEAALGRWIDDAPAPLEVDTTATVDQISSQLDQGDPGIRPLIDGLTDATLRTARQAVDAATRIAGNAERDLEKARQNLTDHDALPDDQPPPTRPGIPSPRQGTPLWRAVEFTDTLEATERALLEAALDAAGLLDADVTPEGLHTRDDTVLVGNTSAPGLRDWLRPAGDGDPGLVAAAIGAIGAGADSGTLCWVDLDGTWANGPLAGRWTKAAPEYIGAGARAEARALRRLSLAAAVEGAEASAEAAEADRQTADGELTTTTLWCGQFPTVNRWAGAERDVGASATRMGRVNDEQTKATADLGVVEARTASIIANLDQAITVAGCPPEGVADARAALDHSADAARDLSRSAAAHDQLAERLTSALADLDRLTGEANDAHISADKAELAAAESEARYATALATQGAEVEALLAEKARLEQALEGLRDRESSVDGQKRDARDAEIRAKFTLEETGRRRIEATEERDAALADLVVVVGSGHVSLAVALDASRDATDYLQPTAGRTLARQIAATVDEQEATDDARNRAVDRLVKEYQTLNAEIGGSYDPHLDTVALGLFGASATLNGSIVGIAELNQALADDVEQRRAAIDRSERDLIEQHLRDEVGNHLGERLHAATSQVHQINEVLRSHPTNSGQVVQLVWKVDEAAGTGVGEAVKALLTAPSTRSEEASGALASFLTERVALARRGEIDGADLGERLVATLDYRSWYGFSLKIRSRGQEEQMTSRTVGAGSGGQQAKLGHLPLLAAAAAFYSSSPSAPRLCFLDEAFAGIDGPNTTDLLNVTVTLDLDMVMTNFDAWFCLPQVPGLAIYHLEKFRDAPGVAAIRYEWDGNSQQELDPWLAT